MRKRAKNKRHSCGMCKPHKRGGANRWKPKDEMLLKEAEEMARNAMEIMYDQFMYDAIDDFDFCEKECCNAVLV